MRIKRRVIVSSDEDEPVAKVVQSVNNVSKRSAAVSRRNLPTSESATSATDSATNSSSHHSSVSAFGSSSSSSAVYQRPVKRAKRMVEASSDDSESDCEDEKDVFVPRKRDRQRDEPALTPAQEKEIMLANAMKKMNAAKKVLIENFGEDQLKNVFKNGRTRILKPTKLSRPNVTTQKCLDHVQLKPYQLAGVQWLQSMFQARCGAILADEMGLGKTMQALLFLEQQLKVVPEPALVVVPVSLLRNWEEEIQKWTSLKVFRYHASAAPAREEQAQKYFAERFQQKVKRPFDIILTTPNVLMNAEDRRKFLRKIEPYSFLVADEGHFLKNSSSNRVVSLHRIRATMRILLTGTPIQNDLNELVNLLWFTQPHAFQPIMDFIKQDGTVVLRDISRVGAPFILRRSKDDVLGDLPAKHTKTLWCEMDQFQRMKYNEAKNSSDSSKYKNVYTRLRRICNAPILAQLKFTQDDYKRLAVLLRTRRDDYKQASEYTLMNAIHNMSDFAVHEVSMELGLSQPWRATPQELLNGCKIKTMIKLLKERTGKKTLVFSQFTQYIDVLENAFLMHNISYIRLDGSTAAEDRQKLVHQFNGPDGPQVFVLSTKAGGTGLNLVSADACILMDLDFNPQNNRQAEDRIHRLGQTREVTIYYLICKDTIEENVLHIDARKIELDAKFGGNISARNTLKYILKDLDKREKAQLQEIDAIRAQQAAMRTETPEDVESEEDQPLKNPGGEKTRDLIPTHLGGSQLKESRHESALSDGERSAKRRAVEQNKEVPQTGTNVSDAPDDDTAVTTSISIGNTEKLTINDVSVSTAMVPPPVLVSENGDDVNDDKCVSTTLPSTDDKNTITKSVNRILDDSDDDRPISIPLTSSKQGLSNIIKSSILDDDSDDDIPLVPDIKSRTSTIQ